MFRALIRKAFTQYSYSLSSNRLTGVTTVTCSRTQNYCKQEGINATVSNDEDEIEFNPETTFPNKETRNILINGVKWCDLPIVHINATANNTLLSACRTETGPVVNSESCGTVGFRNIKKQTTIAAQSAGFTMGQKIIRKGMNVVRINVKGIGPGRLAAMSGIKMAGITIVSITDSTPIPFNGNRPRRPRRT